MSAKISPLDRCDADQSERPYVWLYRKHDDRTMAFCAHHYRLTEVEWAVRGFGVVEDKRAELEPTKAPAEVTA
jgi:hypothetical protein